MNKDHGNDKKRMISNPTMFFIAVVAILLLILNLCIATPVGINPEYIEQTKHIQACSHKIVQPEKDILIDINKISSVTGCCDGIYSYNNREKIGFNKCLGLFGEKEIKHFEKLNQNELNEIDPCIKMVEYYTENSPIKINRIADMKVARIAPKTVVLKDGKVLIIGGEGKKVDSVELFNPKTTTFTLISDDLSQYYQTHKRHFFDEPYTLFELKEAFLTDPILLPDGQVYYLGAIYNPNTYKFSKANSSLTKKMVKTEEFLSSSAVSNKDDFKPFKVFQDSKTLMLKCSDGFRNCSAVLLEDIINGTVYHPGIFNEDNAFPYLSAIINLNNNVIIWKVYNIYEYNPSKGTIRNLDLENKDFHNIYDVSIIDKNQLFIIAKSLNNEAYGYLYSLEDNKILQKYKLPVSVVNHFFRTQSNNPNSVLSPSSNNFEIKKLSSELLAINSDHFMIIINLKNKNQYTIYNYNMSLLQPLIKLNDDKYLILGGSEYNYEEVNVFNMKKSKYAAIITIKQ